MKIGICGDVHWSQYSSIVRKRGEKYSIRLENLINSINWFNNLVEKFNCSATFFMGDFFDKSELNAEEISALKMINWAKIPNYFIAGNHEMMSTTHTYSSANIFNLLDTGKTITVPSTIKFEDTEFCILPYILESDRKALADYFTAYTGQKRVILSHNDLAGIQMGKFISKAGFSLDEIEQNTSLYINGHLHNGSKVTDKILNIGNITGQNFSEDAIKYNHVAFILDTNTLQIQVFENPFAFNFYKLDAVENVLNLEAIKNNAIVTLKCLDTDFDYYKEQLNKRSNIIESRIIVQANPKQVLTEDLTETLTVDHLESFKQFIINNLENSKELMEELTEVLK